MTDTPHYPSVGIPDTIADGDAVTPTAPAGSGWIVFRHADFGDSERGRGFTATVARSLPGAAVLEVWHAKPGSDRPDDGRTSGQLAVPDPGGQDRRAEVTATREPAAGPGDLDLVRRGAQRLSSVRIGTP